TRTSPRAIRLHDFVIVARERRRALTTEFEESPRRRRSIRCDWTYRELCIGLDGLRRRPILALAATPIHRDHPAPVRPMHDALDLDRDARRDAPLYRQIVDQVRGRIRSGALPVGYRLPPTRDLARRLKTHRNTVVRAYEELAASGYTVSTVGRGTFVSDS